MLEVPTVISDVGTLDLSRGDVRIMSSVFSWFSLSLLSTIQLLISEIQFCTEDRALSTEGLELKLNAR